MNCRFDIVIVNYTTLNNAARDFINHKFKLINKIRIFMIFYAGLAGAPQKLPNSLKIAAMRTKNALDLKVNNSVFRQVSRPGAASRYFNFIHDFPRNRPQKLLKLNSY